MLKMPASNKPVDPLLVFTIRFTMVSLIVFAVIPLVKVLIQSFISYEGVVSFDAYLRAFTSEENFKALSHSLTLGAASGILSTAIGFLLQCRLCPHALEAAFQPDCHASDCFAAFCHRIVDYLVVRQQGADFLHAARFTGCEYLRIPRAFVCTNALVLSYCILAFKRSARFD